MKNSNPFVTASELGDYVYCKRGWWLKENGQNNKNSLMTAGTIAHNVLAKKLDLFATLKVIALFVVGAGILIIVLLMGYILLFHP